MGHEIEFWFDKKGIILGLTKNLYLFLNCPESHWKPVVFSIFPVAKVKTTYIVIVVF